MAYWLFQGNLKYYRVLDAIKDLSEMYWTLTRYKTEPAAGDGVLLWIAGLDAGIYAIATLVEAPQLLTQEGDLDYWLERKVNIGAIPQVKMRFTHKLLAHPLLKSTLKTDPILQTLPVIRQPNSTNYKITEAHWQRVHELITT
jgi:hypothetical protein